MLLVMYGRRKERVWEGEVKFVGVVYWSGQEEGERHAQREEIMQIAKEG